MINKGAIYPFSYHQLFELFGRSTLAVGIMSTAMRQQAQLSERLIYLGKYAAHEQLAHFLYEIFLRLKRINAVEYNSFLIPLTQELISDALEGRPV